MSDFDVPHNETAQPSPVTVREAVAADAPGIAAVHVAAWEGGYRGMIPDEALDRRSVAGQTEMWKAILGGAIDGTPPWVAVAEKDQTTIGFASMGIQDESAEISALYVDSGSWREGAGSALMHAALAEATRKGCTDVTLWVLEPNRRARAFYERFGFSDDGARQRDSEGWPLELRMRRPA